MEKIITKEEILNAISKMSVIDLVDFIEIVEKKFNISAGSFNTNTLTTASTIEVSKENEPAVEKSEFKIILKDFGSDKIKVIKIVRGLTKLGLKESKDLVENVPALIKDKLAKEEADTIKKELELAGAVVLIE